MPNPSGAYIIARTLQDLGVTVLFGLVGVPVADIAEEAISLGIRFIGFRNEQACSYAATAYGYLTGKPGICLLVGGPGILHGMAGIGNASANAWPAVFLGGSSEQTLNGKGAFQEMDSVSLLTPHTKMAMRPAKSDPYTIVSAIHRAYRFAWYGRPGPTFVDLPGDLIMMPTSDGKSHLDLPSAKSLRPPPKAFADADRVAEAVTLLKVAKAPLVVIGKGAAYARAEGHINELVTRHNLPFLPTPMGKGVIPDDHPLSATAARSAALKNADVVVLLGARLNWILHYGEPPKYSSGVKIIQVDISPEELGRVNGHGEPAVSLFGDIGAVVSQINAALGGWTAFPKQRLDNNSHPYLAALSASAHKNNAAQSRKSLAVTQPGQLLSYERAYHIINAALNDLTSPSQSEIVWMSEGANTMDISRTSFSVSEPRQRLDAGTYATMGVGGGYALAAYAAYNYPVADSKRVVCLFGDSAFGFSGMEIETMARHRMPIVIFVMNNSGIYHGDSISAEEWAGKQVDSVKGETVVEGRGKKGLRSTSLLWETRYDMMAEMVGGKGYFVKTEEDLGRATRDAWEWGKSNRNVVLINVVIESGRDKTISFAWEMSRQNEKVLPKQMSIAKKVKDAKL
jgi:2-hydroxyacyl-CoA lyase 1